MDGLLIIDKPMGITSHDVVRRVRRLYKTRKVGHAGTLDPLATGVLVLGLGDGTRLIQFLMEGEKSYRATFKLGEATDTQDSEGQIVDSRPTDGLRPERVGEACRSFVGRVSQIPPMYSALKKDGVPLYKLARQGVEIEREARSIDIFKVEVVDIDLPYVTIDVDCSKGTYIRTLCHDIGRLLGCGAHMTALRRTRSAPFAEADCHTLERITDETGSGDPGCLTTLLQAVRNYPAFEVAEDAASRLRNGVPPQASEVSGGALPAEGKLVVLLDRGELRALAAYTPSRLSEKRGDFELLRVFIRS